MSSSAKKALVTGATGFLGGHLVNRLLRDGWDVTALGRNEKAGRILQSKGAQFVCVDLANADATTEACRDQTIVFHCAARSSPWGRYNDFYRDNVLATRNLVAASITENVARFVHVSSPSIYFGFEDQLNITESQRLPAFPANHYVRTKIEAEAVVDAAASRIETITLRPRAIFGAGDTTLFPRIIRANGSRGFPLIRNADPLIDITCVENVVDALILAVKAPPPAIGKKFNISNGTPWPRSRLLAELFRRVGIPYRTRNVSYPVAYACAATLEYASSLLTLSSWEPPLTRYSVGVLSKSQTLDITAARRLLGYTPAKTIEEGMDDFALWWKESHAAC